MNRAVAGIVSTTTLKRHRARDWLVSIEIQIRRGGPSPAGETWIMGRG